MKLRLVVPATLLAALAAAAALAQEKKDRETKVRDDKARFAAEGRWIYDDLARGAEEAKKSGKPLLVVFRCIPCEACAQLDEDVVAGDPIVAKLLDRFVCVRMPKMNGIDLSVFQFDYDQSWAAFFLEPDMRILGRYGTRSSQKDSTQDVSLEGFAQSMERAIALHEGEPSSRTDIIDGKQSRPSAVKRPEDFPSLKGKFTSSLDWQGKVVQSCLHCHMVSEAERLTYRADGRSIPDRVLFPYPNPRTLGLVMDPKASARVKSVTPGSPAERAGFVAGDDIDYFGSSSVLSVADIQWELHGAPESDSPASLQVEVRRAGSDGVTTAALTLALPPAWRRTEDISWRASSWDLRRMATGGMLLEDVPDAERVQLGLDLKSMALRAKHVGQYGEHAAAKNAGFRKGDVLLSIAGKTGRMRETDVLSLLTTRLHPPGSKVPVTVLRGAEKLELTLPMQ
jgi:serine protease Do